MQPATPMPALPGYTIHACIRRDADEAIYRATRRADGLGVVIKLSAAGADTSEAYSRLKYELDTIRALDSNTVTRALELVRYEDRFALIFESFGGQSLSSLLANRRPDLQETLTIGRNVATALRKLHTAQFVHTSISPVSVIYRSEDGLVRLSNLGQATPLNSEAPFRPDAALGSLAYISPEQTGRMNRKIDSRSDLYSLGVLLYELLMGRLPFPSEDPLEIVHSHLAVTPDAPASVDASIPPPVSAVVMKLLAKSPEDRYQTAAGVAHDLEHCLGALDETGAIEPFELAAGDVRSTFTPSGMLYGRDAELARILDAFAECRNGASRELLVSGPAGIGKTLLVDEAGARIARQRGRFISGRFEPLQQNVPLSALATAFEGLVHGLLMETEEQLEHARAEIVGAVQGNGRVLTEILPSLELVIGQQPAVPELNALESHNRLTLTFVNFVQVLCGADRPLVLFLDDMQNADNASVNLAMTLLSSRIEGLLMIMAKRDAEGDQAAALMRAIEDQRRRGAVIEQLGVGPLSEGATRRLVADMLQADPETAAPLASAVWRKSAGNPFFIKKLLQTLYESGAVYFSSRANRFAFDLERVEGTEITDNVADLLVHNLSRLPDHVRTVLQVAAVIGRTFDVDVVAEVTGRSTSEIVEALDIAGREELIAPQSKPELLNPRQLDSPLIHRRFAFAHERVRQAAYSMISSADLPATHLSVGRALQRRRPTDRGDALFDIVHHLSTGADAITDADERLNLVDMNLEAGRKAKTATAYGIAIRCLERAIALLGESGWMSHAERLFDAHSLLAECMSLSGRFEDALQTVAVAVEHADSTIQRAKLRTLQVNICTAMGRIHEAMEHGVATARELGFAIPDDAGEIDEQTRAEFEIIHETIARRSVESLIDLPEMTDPAKTTLMALLMYCLPSAIQTNAGLFSLMCCRMVTLSLQHGNCATSPKAYGSLAVVLSGMFGRYEEGERFARLGAKLAERFEEVAGRSAAYFTWAMFASAWVKPVAESLAIYEQSMQFGLREGDHPHAAYAGARSTTHEMFMGRPLPEVRANAERNLDLLHRLDDRVNLDLLIPRIQWIKWLQGELSASGSLDGPDFDEQRVHDAVAATGNQSMISHFAIIRLMHRYMSGDFGRALECARESERVLAGSTGMIVVAEHSLFAALTACALLETAGDDERTELEALLDKNEARLRQWAESCPENFAHMRALVAAERLRVAGEPWAATEAYDRAIAAADDQAFLNVEALAAELAERMWRSLGKPEFAKSYRQRAASAYQLWGASRKVRELAGDGAQAGHDEPIDAGHGSHGSTADGALDFAAVVKAANALSREIVLERLLGKLMNVILEYAGADAGALLLDSDDGLSVQASKASGAETEVMTDVSLTEATNVSAGIVNYVARTRQLVVLDNARESRFRGDAYVQKQRPRSVLCAPVLHQGSLIGVLYLENTLVENAFTPNRVEALGILIAQLSISIQNAKLFAVQQRQTEELEHYRDHLEELVKERTRELESAQGRLLDMSRKAGMAEVASGVLHNVGNVLNSVNVGTSLVDEELRTMRTEGVTKTAAMLEEHVDDLASFLEQDDRGRKIAAYLGKLGASLEQTKGRVAARLRAVGEHLEHVKNIIAAQQGYSRTAAVAESCLLQNIFEAALEITSASLRLREIEVVREFEELPEVRVDRHQVLQILVNLISNASHALADSRNARRIVVLGLARDGDKVRLSVRDNGTGIIPENMDRIFTHGFTTKPNGNGFGLHNCAIAAQQMSGRITAASDGPGAGAVFMLELPLELESADAESRTLPASAFDTSA